MDFMDTDQVHDVPDTPDRLATRNVNGRGCMEKESDSSVASHSVNTIVSDEAGRSRLRGRSKLVIDNGNSKRLSFHPAKNLSIPKKTAVEGDIKIPLGNSSSSKHAHLFRRVTTENTANHESKYPLHSQQPEKGKALCISQSFPSRENAVLDLTWQNGSANGWPKDFPNSATGNRHSKEIRKGPTLANDISTLQDIANSSATTHFAYKGKEKVDDTCRGGSGIDCGKGSVGDSQPKSGKGNSESIHSIPPPRVSGQKRLVRNGRISPHNTAKANRVPENHSYVSTGIGNDNGTLESDCSSSLIRELVAEDYNSPRGKAVISHLVTSKEHDTKPIDLSTRHSVTHSEVASGTSNANGDTYSGFEGLGGWRTTHTHTQKINHSSSDEGQLHPGTKNDRIKRQKQGPLSSNHGETSTSASVDTEIVFLGSSREPSNSRSTRNQNSRGPGILDPVIEIDEFSPRTRRGCHNVAFNSNSDSDDRARQLEVDEMLARELQEQLYSEVPAVGGSEMDANIALALQQEGTSHHAFSSGSNPVFHTGSSVLPNTYRQSQPRSSHDPSIRRGARVRRPNSTRLTRLRRSLPRHSPQITQRERSSLFPPDMDMDMRIHILEALEAFSDMGGTSNFLEVEHEFNENDYETLLALDENNYQHGGASLGLINRLPQSTVQGDNFEEACAICLDTPSSGDTIRHLPCLHKFHKDCIDPWLRRRTSCPICKSSIT